MVFSAASLFGWARGSAPDPTRVILGLTLAAIVATILIALVALVGWLFGVPQLGSWIAGESDTKYNAAISLLLLAGALAALVGDARTPLRTGLAIGAVLIAAATLFQHAASTDLGIDELVVDDPVQSGVGAPGRMGIATALAFLLAGLALIPGRDSRVHALADLAAVGTLFIAMVAIGRYGTGAFEATQVEWLTQTSLPTALGLSLIAVGSILARPEHGIAALLVSETSGGIVLRRLLPATLVFLPVSVMPILVGNLAGWWQDDVEVLILISVVAVFLGAIALPVALAAERADEDLRQTQRDLANSNAELSRSNQALQRFAHAAAHDMREPLLVIDGFSTLLQESAEGRENDEEARYIENIISGSQRLKELIDALLSYSKAESDPLELEYVSIDDTTSEVCETLKSQIEAAAVRVSIGEMPMVMTNRAAMRQVFQNVISNALRFGGSELTAIEVEAKRYSQGWCFEIADDGAGIPQGQHETIFEMFKRGHDKSYPGSGIGLATCRRILRRQGGNIWVEDRPGGGAWFKFVVPDEASEVSIGAESPDSIARI